MLDLFRAFTASDICNGQRGHTFSKTRKIGDRDNVAYLIVFAVFMSIFSFAGIRFATIFGRRLKRAGQIIFFYRPGSVQPAELSDSYLPMRVILAEGVLRDPTPQVKWGCWKVIPFVA